CRGRHCLHPASVRPLRFRPVRLSATEPGPQPFVPLPILSSLRVTAAAPASSASVVAVYRHSGVLELGRSDHRLLHRAAFHAFSAANRGAALEESTELGFRDTVRVWGVAAAFIVAANRRALYGQGERRLRGYLLRVAGGLLLRGTEGTAGLERPQRGFCGTG